MKKILTLICVLLITACASTSEGRPSKDYVFVSSFGTSFGVGREYIDPNTIKVLENGNRSANVITVYSHPRIYGNGGTYYQAILSLKEFKCSDRTIKTLSSSAYGDANATIFVGPFSVENSWAGGRRTNTVAEKLANYACDL